MSETEFYAMHGTGAVRTDLTFSRRQPVRALAKYREPSAEDSRPRPWKERAEQRLASSKYLFG